MDDIGALGNSVDFMNLLQVELYLNLHIIFELVFRIKNI